MPCLEVYIRVTAFPFPFTMSSWRIQAFSLLLSVCASWASSLSFENTAISRSVELGGTLVHVSTTYSIKSLQDRAQTYTIALGSEEFEKTSWLEVKTKVSGTTKLLEVQARGQDPDRYVAPRHPTILFN